MCSLCQARATPGSFSCSADGTGSVAKASAGSSANSSAALPSFTVQQQAAYLTDGYWNAVGWNRHAFDVKTGGTISVNLSGLGTMALNTARIALDAWTAVSGLRFSEIAGSAQINFSENQEGAWANSATYGQTIVSSVVNVAADWVNTGAYYLQTYLHEIGHALGLGHGGNYNGSADFAANVHYQEDSWQRSVMSYFDQDQNPYATATFAFVATPMLADIAAIHDLYGMPASTRTGNDVYGDNRTAAGSGTEVLWWLSQTIHDSGGTDTFDFSLRSADQRIDLHDGAFSDIDGRVGNLAIALGTVIENAIGGGGDDTIVGNAAANRLVGNAGNDTLAGEAGDDMLAGGTGDDSLQGGAGIDTALYTGAFAAYSLTKTATGFAVVGEGTDTLTGIEWATFSDGVFDFVHERFLTNGIERVRTGTGAGDTLSAGDGGGWTLKGLGGADRLIGGDGADILHGDAGADRMIGGRGDDTYYVDQARDAVVEQADGGFDTVYSTATHFLAAHVEALVLTGTGAVHGSGNGLANTLVGNNAANRLDGGRGADRLQGGGGADTYIVDDIRDVVDETVGQLGDDRAIDTVHSTVSFALGAFVENLRLEGRGKIDGTGNALSNLISGNAASNVIAGGAGRDMLYGKGGSDIFVFAEMGAANMDILWDFGSDDRIRLERDVFGQLDINGDGALDHGSFVVGGRATQAKAQAIYNANTGILSFDADGTGTDGAQDIASLGRKLAFLDSRDFLVA